MSANRKLKSAYKAGLKSKSFGIESGHKETKSTLNMP